MLFDATIAGTPAETINCRVFDPGTGLWLTGADTWGPEAEAQLTPLTPTGTTRHFGQVYAPYAGVVVEYLLEGRVIGEDPVQPTGSNQFIIPVVTGTAGKAEFTTQRRFTLNRGDTYHIPVSLDRDCQGWEAWFGGKEKADQQHYDMPLRQLQFEDAETGTLYLDLTPEDTELPRTIYAEIELRRGEETSTPERYTFRIADDIVKR